MISAQIFAEKWRVMVQRFNREVEPDEANRYYRYLSPKLDNEQFVKAAERLWAESSRWPKPADYIEAAPPPSRPLISQSAGQDRDPWWQPVHMILQNSAAHHKWENIVRARKTAFTVVDDDTGPPFYFPLPVTEVVASTELVGIRWVDRPDLRGQFHGEREA